MSPTARRLPNRWRSALVAAALLTGGSAVAQRSAPSIPRPDLSAMQPAPRLKIEAIQQTLEGLLAEDSPAQDRAAAFTFLGQLFHAFNLLDSAAASYSAASELFPADPRAVYLRGLVHDAQGDLPAAIADYRRASELQPNVIEARLRLGDALLEAGDRQAAIAEFQQALTLSQDSAAAHFGLGRALVATEPARAVASLERALALQPDASILHASLSEAYRRLGNLAKAAEHTGLQGAREVEFSDPLATGIATIARSTAFEVLADLAGDETVSDRDFFGFVLSEFSAAPAAAENLARLLGHLESAGASSPYTLGRLHYALGGLLLATRRDEAAKGQFERAIELAPRIVDARLRLGILVARSGELEAAVEHFDAALKGAPEDGEALNRRAVALIELQRLDEAERDLRRAVELQPQSADAQLGLANVLERRGRGDEALDHYDRAVGLEADPEERAKIETLRAGFLVRSGRGDEAIAALRAALERDPANLELHGTLASLLGQLGRYDEAADAYRRWVDSEASSNAARVGEATALILGGRYLEARDRLLDGRRALPDSLDILDLLARHLAASPDHGGRDGKRALELAQELFERLPTTQSLETLAMAYAQAGRFTDAQSRQRQLIEGGAEEADRDDLQRWQRNLSLYEQGQPCCADD